jgi:hypothetical protein
MPRFFHCSAALAPVLAGALWGLPLAARAQQPSPTAPAVQPSAPPAGGDPANLFSPADQVQPGRLPFTLRQVFHRLARDKTETMPFTETRTTAIMKNPLRQTGTMRSSKENGLSLEYESPRPHTIIVDDKGLIERTPDGHERQITVAEHPELSALTDLYLNLLRGNADKLFDYADVYFTGNAQNWQMGLAPHDANLSKHVGKVVISGANHEIHRLENQLPNNESRVLELGKAERNPKYGPDVLQAYFRAPGS